MDKRIEDMNEEEIRRLQEAQSDGRDVDPDNPNACFVQALLFLIEREPAEGGWGQWHYFMWLNSEQQKRLEYGLKKIGIEYRRQRWIW